MRYTTVQNLHMVSGHTSDPRFFIYLFFTFLDQKGADRRRGGTYWRQCLCLYVRGWTITWSSPASYIVILMKLLLCIGIWVVGVQFRTKVGDGSRTLVSYCEPVNLKHLLALYIYIYIYETRKKPICLAPEVNVEEHTYSNDLSYQCHKSAYYFRSHTSLGTPYTYSTFGCFRSRCSKKSTCQSLTIIL